MGPVEGQQIKKVTNGNSPFARTTLIGQANIPTRRRRNQKSHEPDFRQFFIKGTTSSGSRTATAEDKYRYLNKLQHSEVAKSRRVPRKVAKLRRGRTEMSEKLYHEVTRLIHPRYVQKWLKMPLRALGGRAPQDLVDRGQESLIFEAIERLRSGNVG
jgi:hypothetical protein